MSRGVGSLAGRGVCWTGLLAAALYGQVAEAQQPAADKAASCQAEKARADELVGDAQRTERRDALLACAHPSCPAEIRDSCIEQLAKALTSPAPAPAPPPSPAPSPTPAPSAPTTRSDTAVCLTAHAEAQRQRTRGALLEARRQLMVCSSMLCPALVRDDCNKRLKEVIEATPSAIFGAVDEDGHDTSNVKVYLDDKLLQSHLSGRPEQLDPGRYTVRFEYGDKQASRNLVLKEGERGRRVDVSFEVKKVRDFEEFTEQAIVSLGERDKLRFSFNMFGDVSVLATDDAAQSSEFSFALGQLGFLATADLLTSVRALSEFVMETGPDGPLVDLERLVLQWEHDWFRIRAGRIHTAIGYWNQAYHHGAWLQTSVDRPRVLAFEDEGGVLPVHSTGVEMRALADMDVGKFHAMLTIANGRGNNPDDIRVVDDTNAAKSIAVRLGYASKNDNFRAGVSGLYDRIAPAGLGERALLPDVAMNEWLANAYIVYHGDTFEVHTEGFSVTHTGGGDSWTTLGAFALAGVTVGDIKPYMRLEFAVAPATLDPFFVPDPVNPGSAIIEDLIESAAGVRIDVTRWSALKAEYRYFRLLDSGADHHTAVLNWAFGI